MNGKIRLAEGSDAEAIHNLHTRSVRGLCSGDHPPDVIDGWLAGRSPEGYKGIAKHEMYVYEARGEVVGWSHVNSWGIVGLFVDATHARKGIGRTLFEHGLGIVRQSTSEHLEFPATVPAAAFYEKCGCTRVGTSTIQKNDVDVPTVIMALPEVSAEAE